MTHNLSSSTYSSLTWLDRCVCLPKPPTTDSKNRALQQRKKVISFSNAYIYMQVCAMYQFLFNLVVYSWFLFLSFFPSPVFAHPDLNLMRSEARAAAALASSQVQPKQLKPLALLIVRPWQEKGGRRWWRRRRDFSEQSSLSSSSSSGKETKKCVKGVMLVLDPTLFLVTRCTMRKAIAQIKSTTSSLTSYCIHTHMCVCKGENQHHHHYCLPACLDRSRRPAQWSTYPVMWQLPDMRERVATHVYCLQCRWQVWAE